MLNSKASANEQRNDTEIATVELMIKIEVIILSATNVNVRGGVKRRCHYRHDMPC
jgi:hypothetical protein